MSFPLAFCCRVCFSCSILHHADLALIEDASMRPFVELYAANQDKFFVDFASAFGRLLELGVPFPAGAAALHLKPTA